MHPVHTSHVFARFIAALVTATFATLSSLEQPASAPGPATEIALIEQSPHTKLEWRVR